MIGKHAVWQPYWFGVGVQSNIIVRSLPPVDLNRLEIAIIRGSLRDVADQIREGFDRYIKHVVSNPHLLCCRTYIYDQPVL